MLFTKIKLRQRDIILSNLKEISAGTDCKFLYGRTMLYTYPLKIALLYQKADNQKVIMKSPRLFPWRYKYLIKAVHMVWSDGTKMCLYQDHCWEENE